MVRSCNLMSCLHLTRQALVCFRWPNSPALSGQHPKTKLPYRLSPASPFCPMTLQFFHRMLYPFVLSIVACWPCMWPHATRPCHVPTCPCSRQKAQHQCDPYSAAEPLHLCNLLLPLHFRAHPLLVIFGTHLTLHRSLSCPNSHASPRFPCAFLTALCPFGHNCCLDTVCLPLFRLPFWRYRWNRLILYFSKSPKARISDISNYLLHLSLVLHPKTHQKHVRTTESTQYPSCICLTSACFG
jgi:hypothetical protein